MFITPSLSSLWCLCFTPVTARSCSSSKCGLFYFVLDQQRGIPFLLKPSGQDSSTRNVCLQITLVLGDNDRWPLTILGEILIKVIDPIFEWLFHPGRQVKWKICQCLQKPFSETSEPFLFGFFFVDLLGSTGLKEFIILLICMWVFCLGWVSWV